MRILFVSSETPLFPAGGISTYLEYIVPALKAQGHEIHLFTFRKSESFVPPASLDPFDADKVHIEVYSENVVRARYPSPSRFSSVSFYLLERLRRVIAEWDIDVVEATDYEAPCLALFQALQVITGAEKMLFSTFHHGLTEVIFEADQIGYPDYARANNLCERQQMRISDVVIAPSVASSARLSTLGIQGRTHIVREPYAFRHPPADLDSASPEIQYIGRLSIQKGVDKLIYGTSDQRVRLRRDGGLIASGTGIRVVGG